MTKAQAGRLPSWLFPVGIVVGAAVAFVSLGRPSVPSDDLPAHAVARVGERLITQAELDRALTRVVADRRAPTADAELRQHVLGRLIDEALLVEFGVSNGLCEADPELRTRLGGAVIDRITAEAADTLDDTDVAALEAFYDAHPDRFIGSPRLHVRRLVFATAAAAAAASERLAAGTPWAEVRTFAKPAVDPPDGPVPPDKLRDYLGPTALAAAQALPVGGVSPPLVAGDQHVIVTLVAQHPGARQAFDRERVATERRRDAGDAALRRFLADRRGAVGVVRSAPP